MFQALKSDDLNISRSIALHETIGHPCFSCAAVMFCFDPFPLRHLTWYQILDLSRLHVNVPPSLIFYKGFDNPSTSLGTCTAFSISNDKFAIFPMISPFVRYRYHEDQNTCVSADSTRFRSAMIAILIILVCGAAPWTVLNLVTAMMFRSLCPSSDTNLGRASLGAAKASHQQSILKFIKSIGNLDWSRILSAVKLGQLLSCSNTACSVCLLSPLPSGYPFYDKDPRSSYPTYLINIKQNEYRCSFCSPHGWVFYIIRSRLYICRAIKLLHGHLWRHSHTHSLLRMHTHIIRLV